MVKILLLSEHVAMGASWWRAQSVSADLPLGRSGGAATLEALEDVEAGRVIDIRRFRHGLIASARPSRCHCPLVKIQWTSRPRRPHLNRLRTDAAIDCPRHLG
jgi:hypothetical protein